MKEEEGNEVYMKFVNILLLEEEDRRKQREMRFERTRERIGHPEETEQQSKVLQPYGTTYPPIPVTPTTPKLEPSEPRTPKDQRRPRRLDMSDISLICWWYRDAEEKPKRKPKQKEAEITKEPMQPNLEEESSPK
jgi:hypothetical protein